MKTILAIFSLLMITSRSVAQSNGWETATNKEIVASYQKTWNWFAGTPSYGFKLKYVSYKDHTTKEVFDKSEGYYKKNGSKYKTVAAGIKTIQNDKVKIIIDTVDRLVTALNPGNLTPAMADVKDLEAMLTHVKALKKKKTTTGTCYHIDFNKNELYVAYEFTVNEKGLLDNLVYYYSEQNKKDKNNTDSKVKPRMEVFFTDYEVPAKNSDFAEKGITLTEKGTINLGGVYKNYQLKDYRYAQKNN